MVHNQSSLRRGIVDDSLSWYSTSSSRVRKHCRTVSYSAFEAACVQCHAVAPLGAYDLDGEGGGKRLAGALQAVEGGQGALEGCVVNHAANIIAGYLAE